jgi:hypothetical protein
MPTSMTLLEQFVNFAESEYEIDWPTIRRAVVERCNLDNYSQIPVLDPRKFPSYWCVPVLVGNYVGASRRAVLDDTEAFVAGCVVRHFMFESGRQTDHLGYRNEFHCVVDAYDRCRVDRIPSSSFDVRFSAKCLPWILLLALGTRSILKEATEWVDYESAMKAIILVYSCLQLIDDWHDRDEDVTRLHWNMWVHEPASSGLAVMGPLLDGAYVSVEHLRPHLLRRALSVQLWDTAGGLREVADACSEMPHERPGESA